MAPCLENCPNEIIETIIVLLSLEDACSLRQSSRALAEKSSQIHFRSYYRSKRVLVTEAMLQEFVNMTKPGRLGCELQNLALVGLPENADSDDLDRDNGDITDGDTTNNKTAQQVSQTNFNLLAEAFSNIAANSETGNLHLLSLEVKVAQGDSERLIGRIGLGLGIRRRLNMSVWPAAAETCHAAFNAIAASGLLIEKLNIFNDRQLHGCSLARNELSALDFKNARLLASLACLDCLSISLSNRIIEDIRYPTKADIRSAKTKATSPINVIGLARLLQSCGRLKDLEIHYFCLRRPDQLLKPRDSRHEWLLRAVVNADQLPTLSKCTLRGVYTTENDLLKFIKRTAVRHLIMENVWLSSGSLQSIFDYCASEDADMKEIFFDGLKHDRGMVYFDGPGQFHGFMKPFYHYDGPIHHGLGLHRIGGANKRPITYENGPTRTRGSPRSAVVHDTMIIEYGR